MTRWHLVALVALVGAAAASPDTVRGAVYGTPEQNGETTMPDPRPMTCPETKRRCVDCEGVCRKTCPHTFASSPAMVDLDDGRRFAAHVPVCTTCGELDTETLAPAWEVAGR